MKKIFLSVPMRNRTRENIERSLRKMRLYAKTALGDDVEFIDNLVVDEEAPKDANYSLWCLGKAIEKLSQADVLLTVDAPYFLQARGVYLEKEAFLEYNRDSHKVLSKKHYVITLPIELVMEEEELNALLEHYNSNMENMKAVTSTDCGVTDIDCSVTGTEELEY